MAVAINDPLAITNNEKLLDGSNETGGVVARLCVAFHESQRFPHPVSDKKIGLLLSIETKMVWIPWKHFQWHGLADVENGGRIAAF
jgi:hypothetical protein